MARIPTSTALPSMSPSLSVEHGPQSQWQPPVTFLIGGLGAMLILITFALLIFACTYLKLSGYVEGGDGSSEEQGNEGKGNVSKPGAVGFVEQFVVIMAGDETPMFLATPIPKPAATSGSIIVDDSNININVICSNCGAVERGIESVANQN